MADEPEGADIRTRPDVEARTQPELAVVSIDGLVAVALGSGTGTFGIRNELHVVRPARLASADLNHDGRPDLWLGTKAERPETGSNAARYRFSPARLVRQARP
mgnify:CR=1 FL=1